MEMAGADPRAHKHRLSAVNGRRKVVLQGLGERPDRRYRALLFGTDGGLPQEQTHIAGSTWGKSAAETQLLEPIKERVQPLTADNGNEFNGNAEVASVLSLRIYFSGLHH